MAGGRECADERIIQGLVLAVSSDASLISHWIGTIGALFVTIGSGSQALTNLAEYREELRDLRVAREAKGVLVAFVPGVGGLLAAVAVIGALFRLRRRYRELVGRDPARKPKLAGLAVAASAWFYVMLGAFLVMAAGAVQLAIDYGWSF